MEEQSSYPNKIRSWRSNWFSTSTGARSQWNAMSIWQQIASEDLQHSRLDLLKEWFNNCSTIDRRSFNMTSVKLKQQRTMETTLHKWVDDSTWIMGSKQVRLTPNQQSLGQMSATGTLTTRFNERNPTFATVFDQHLRFGNRCKTTSLQPCTVVNTQSNVEQHNAMSFQQCQ